MIRDDTTKGSSKVPLLGDLPLIGALFSNKSTKREKTNLLIFLTPHIIADPEEAHEAARAKVRDGTVLDGGQIRDLGLDRALPAPEPPAPAPAGTLVPGEDAP